MKILLILIGLLSSSASAAVFAYVQSASKSGNTALAFPSNNTAGNMIVVMVSSSTVSAVTDTRGNSYALFGGPNVNSNVQIAVFAAINIAAGANSVTATGLNAGGANSSIAILEYTMPSSFYILGGSNASNPSALKTVAGLSETLIVFGSYDYHSAHSWTGTNLTVRQITTETGSETLGVGDGDATTVTLGTAFTLVGCTLTPTCSNAYVVAFASGGGSGTPSASAFVGLQ